MEKERKGVTRRDFLKTSAIGLGMAGLGFGCSSDLMSLTGSSAKIA